MALSREEIARRLTIARKLAGKSQEEAAKKIRVSSSDFSSIENGLREIELESVDKLALFYGTSINQLMRPGSVYIDLTSLVPRFRKQRKTKDSHVFEAVGCLHSLISAEVELERIFKIERNLNYPKCFGISEGDVFSQAEQHSQMLRNILNLGNGPVADIFSLLEKKLGIRLYRCYLSKRSNVSDLYAFDKEIGACILINANHSLSRQFMSAAHELGHFFSNREHLVLDENELKKSKEEKYADRFSIAFLMPMDGFSKKFHDIKKLHSSDSVIFEILASQFNVSIQACVLRLEDLKLVEKGTWNRLKSKGGFKKAGMRESESSKSSEENNANHMHKHSIPMKVRVMAYEAWNRGLFSEGQLAYLLQIGRIELRKLLFDVEARELTVDEFCR